MTGGSSGKYKEAARQTGIVQFLPPFFSLLCDLHIDSYRSVLIGLPFYHGFGLATLLVSFVMGKTVCLLRRFDARRGAECCGNRAYRGYANGACYACQIMASGVCRISFAFAEVHYQRRRSARCVVGKAYYRTYRTCALQSLWNVRGWFFMLATPQQLIYNGEVSIGKPIRGMQCAVRDADAEGVGTLWVKCKWAMVGRQNCWQSTGDRVLQLSDGRFLHRGRADRMVVCGGENVYPEHVEQVLKEHTLIVDSVVYAVPDIRFWLCA